MNLLEVMKRFPDQESCIEHLEEIRWGDTPECTHCGSKKVNSRHEKDQNKIGRYNCQDCKASFKVTCNTLFHGTRQPLQKWFLAISLMINAKKSLSSHQLARDLELNQMTAWSMMHKIRAEMATKGNTLLKGIVEADETYIGGKPRKGNKRSDDKPIKRGRGTSKTPILGVVERGGAVVAKVADDLTGWSILEFIRKFVQIDESELMTDQYRGYLDIGRKMKHHIINHKEQYVDGDVHTNTIEGFWSLLKRAWYGTHHHYSVAYMPLYVAEACYKYNNRGNKDIFWKFLNDSIKNII